MMTLGGWHVFLILSDLIYSISPANDVSELFSH